MSQMNRSIKPLKPEVLTNQLLWTKNNQDNLVWRPKVYLRNNVIKYVFAHLLYYNIDNYLCCNLVLFLLLQKYVQLLTVSSGARECVLQILPD